MRYVTLEQARALECNSCGDCCDSRRTDGYWTWGELPEDQYRPLNDGRPLIVPLARTAEGWREREREPADGISFSPTRFYCDALRWQPDGRGLCGIHTRERPARCGEFPVHVIGLEDELERFGEVMLETSAFPRCTWYEMTVVRDTDPRAGTSTGEIDQP